jgi:hypothetical protein
MIACDNNRYLIFDTMTARYYWNDSGVTAAGLSPPRVDKWESIGSPLEKENR